MKFVLVVTLGNEAMQTPADLLQAIRRTRFFAAANTDTTPIEVGEAGKIFDRNGNFVGAFHVEEDGDQ